MADSIRKKGEHRGKLVSHYACCWSDTHLNSVFFLLPDQWSKTICWHAPENHHRSECHCCRLRKPCPMGQLTQKTTDSGTYRFLFSGQRAESCACDVTIVCKIILGNFGNYQKVVSASTFINSLFALPRSTQNRWPESRTEREELWDGEKWMTAKELYCLPRLISL